MADESSGLLFQILLDQAAQAETERGLSSVEKKIKGFDELATEAAQNVGESWDEMGADFEKFTTKFDQRFKLVNGKLVDLQTGTKVAASTLRDFSSIDLDAPEALDRFNEKLEDTVDTAREAKDQFSQIRSEVRILSQTSSAIQRLSQPLAIGGTAFIAALALQARSYVNFIEDAGIKGDDTAERWIAATSKVKNAQLNLGETSAQVLLPVYEEVARLAEEAAQFAQDHPDLIRAGVNLAAVAATVGTIGIAVSRGIRLYADVKYLAATALFGSKVDEFVGGVAAFNTGAAISKGGGGAAAGLGAGGALALGGGIAAGAAGLFGSFKLAEFIRDEVGDPIADLFTTLTPLLGPAGPLLSAGANIEKLVDKINELRGASQEAETAVGEVGTGLRDFQQEADLAQATEAFISFRQQEAQAEEQYGQQRASIVAQGLAQINQIEANYQQQRANLIRQFEQSTANALASFQFQQAQAAEQFAQQEAQALRQYQQNRQDTIENAREEELRAEEDHQRELRRLEEDFADQQRDLVAQRDALGLVRARRDFERRKRDLEEDYSVERNRRREQTRERLRDLDEQFQQERQRRREEFAFRQQQALEQFQFQQAQAQAQFEERLKQLDEQHKVEVAQARQQQAERLRELQLQYRQEQVTRRNAFYDILRDLNANLLNEEELRNAYYARMQADLLNFLSSTASAAGSAGSNLPGYQHGGYTPDGPIRTHPGEFILNRGTTRSLERLVGGRLTQEGIRSLASDNSSVTVQLAFPAGLVTKDQMLNALDSNTRKLLKDLTRGVVRD